MSQAGCHRRGTQSGEAGKGRAHEVGRGHSLISLPTIYLRVESRAPRTAGAATYRGRGRPRGRGAESAASGPRSGRPGSEEEGGSAARESETKAPQSQGGRGWRGPSPEVSRSAGPLTVPRSPLVSCLLLFRRAYLPSVRHRTKCEVKEETTVPGTNLFFRSQVISPLLTEPKVHLIVTNLRSFFSKKSVRRKDSESSDL